MPPFREIKPPTATLPSIGRAMTRCECAGVAFADVARRMSAEGKTLETVMVETGVGRMCTGCIPDLRAFAARSQGSE